MANQLTINLLPPEKRHDTTKSVEQLHRMPLVWIIAGVFVVIPLLLAFPLHMRRKRFSILTREVEELRPKKKIVEELRKRTEQLRVRESGFREINSTRNHWGRRLNTLSDLTPKGVWFTDMAIDETTGLVIHGSAIGQNGAEMVNIGRLVQGLKSDEQFTNGVEGLQIESIKRLQDGEIEVVRFTLLGNLIEKPGS